MIEGVSPAPPGAGALPARAIRPSLERLIGPMVCLFLGYQLFQSCQGIAILIRERPAFWNALSNADWLVYVMLWLRALLCGVLILPLLRRRRWAWSAAVGLLAVEVAASLSELSRLFMQITALVSQAGSGAAWERTLAQRALLEAPYRVGYATAAVCVSLALALLLFRSQNHYGVDPGRGWRVLLREGWWAIALCAWPYLLHAAFRFGAVR